MGGLNLYLERNIQKQHLQIKNLKSLKYIFELLKCHDSIKGLLTQKSMLTEFPENPDFSKDERINKSIILILSSHITLQFICQVEFLLKEQQEYYLSDYKFRILEKFELFTLISQGCFDNKKNQQIDFKQVTYKEVLYSRIIEYVLLQSRHKKQLKKYLAARSVAISIFQQKSAIPFNQFIGLVKQQLIYANKMCKKYFTKKFNNPYLNFAIPKLTSSSFILNDQVLALLKKSFSDFNGTVKQIQNSHPQLLKSLQSHNNLYYFCLRIEKMKHKMIHFNNKYLEHILVLMKLFKLIL